MLKFPLVAREDAKDGRRSLERKSAPGESKGERALAPFVAFGPFSRPELESLMDIVLGREGCGVLRVMEKCVERLDTTENR